MPNFTIVSFTQGGLTSLMRKFRGISSAAARTKTFKASVDHRKAWNWDFGACYWRVWACLRNDWFRWHAHKLHPGVERTSRYSGNRQFCLINCLDSDAISSKYKRPPRDDQTAVARSRPQ